uniref:protein-tyrosine-phosphatase n=1 Tax=Pyxicephalus adspersus TaxID=30357 RepID=A0AAV3A6J9_PYXAD|nr:TPA: hypothetical protein GDO54_002999 [Pyxicephalus adspersus]
MIKNTKVSNESVNITDLTPGETYTFLIYTRAADNVTESDPVLLTTCTVPGQAVGITVNNSMSVNSLVVKWTAPTGKVSNYTVTITGDVNRTLQTTSTQITFSDLLPGRNYTVTVQTVSGNCTNTAPSVTEATYGIESSSIALFWGEPINMTGVNKLYSITYWNSSSSVNWTVTSDTPIVTLKNLTSGTNYTVSVVTVGVLGYQSTPVIGCKFTTPDQVYGITVNNNKSVDSLVVNWMGPAGQVSYYVVNITGDVNSTQQISSLSVTFSGLLPGRNYTITVQTVSGDRTNTAQPVTEATYPTAPGNIIFTNIGTNTITLSWGEPINMTSVMKSYSITYWNSSSSVNWTVPSNTPYVTLENMTSGTNYTVSVVTVGVRGYLSTPVISYVFTKPMPVISLQNTSSTTSSVALIWRKSFEYQSSYSYRVQTNVTSPSAVVKNMTVTSESANITDLSAGETYTFIVYTRAADIVTESDPVSITSCTIPEQAVGVTVGNQNSFNSLVVSWTAPAGKVSYYIVSITGDVSKTLQSTSTQVTFTGLLPGRNYTITVLTVSYDCTNTAPPVTEATYPTPPGTITFTDVRTNTITLSWGEPMNMNVMKTYRISYWNSSSSVALTETSNTPSITLQNLTSGTNYTISVVTVGVRGYQSTPVKTSIFTSVIIGAVLGTILGVLGVAVVGGFIWWRRRKSLVMSTSSYLKHFDKQIADSNLGFIEEYEKLGPVGKNLSKTAAEQPENREKNRYTNVLPYDLSRVTLSSNGNSTDDYINANFIPGYINTKEFIASQGPLPKTINDFWRMIWEKDVRVLIMLTKCVEVGKVKCEEYWPSRSSRTFGNLSVSLKNESILPDWTIRDFLVTDIQTKQNKQLRHFHFTAWPDHGVPNTTDDLIRFRNLIRDYTAVHSPPSSPILVHCSAGVGRTGTLIALDRIIKQIEAEDKVDVYGVVYDLRMNRGLMVQTESQYIFLNKCALDVIKTRKTQNTDSIYQNYDIYQNVSSIYQNISKTDI